MLVWVALGLTVGACRIRAGLMPAGAGSPPPMTSSVIGRGEPNACVETNGETWCTRGNNLGIAVDAYGTPRCGPGECRYDDKRGKVVCLRKSEHEFRVRDNRPLQCLDAMNTDTNCRTGRLSACKRVTP